MVAMNREVVYVRLLSISSAVFIKHFFSIEWMWLMSELLSKYNNASQDMSSCKEFISIYSNTEIHGRSTS